MHDRWLIKYMTWQDHLMTRMKNTSAQDHQVQSRLGLKAGMLTVTLPVVTSMSAVPLSVMWCVRPFNCLTLSTTLGLESLFQLKMFKNCEKLSAQRDRQRTVYSTEKLRPCPPVHRYLILFKHLRFSKMTIIYTI